MARKKKWTPVSHVDGVWTVSLSSWKYFHDFVLKEMLDFGYYVWRGDRCDNRKLSSSFDRLYPTEGKKNIEAKLRKHHENFMLAVRGRRGNNPPKIDSENDWWALGQHFGLATPLLDWTKSPFVALFFSFEKDKSPQTPSRAVYAIHPRACKDKSDLIIKAHTGKERPDVVEFFTPLQDGNSRLVNQNGLFSRCTAGKPLEQWIAEQYKGDQQNAVMIKILIPDKGRKECLSTLNRMNINHLTLFPDIYGASEYCNFVQTIKGY